MNWTFLYSLNGVNIFLAIQSLCLVVFFSLISFEDQDFGNPSYSLTPDSNRA